jgi:beta-galactosidase GanA
MRTPSLVLSLLLLAPTLPAAEVGVQPHLAKHGNATQLMVDGKPFLILGAELHNSSSSSLDYMTPIWPKLKAIPLNTVLTPLSWELLEPQEGKFEFTIMDGLIRQAREQHLKIVFLWLAAWKNGMSSYAPPWLKSDTRRFPRVMENGNEVEILSTFGHATVEADSKAFAAVMRHIKEVDSNDHTVLMMQVENEVGVLGASRDQSSEANRAFESTVPAELTRYLGAHRDALYPELRDLWESNGAKTTGTWEEIFGSSPRADEIFMAWHYARYLQAVAAAGKAEFEIPMYVNTWLAGEDTNPGDYPSGGPQPRVVDIWKAAGSAIDIYSPDIYQPNFTDWCRRYSRAGNPLFIPETNGAGVGAANAFYALGERAAIGVSPFGVDSWNDANNELGESYQVLQELTPLLAEHQAKADMHGFVLDRNHPAITFVVNGFEMEISLDQIFGGHSEKGFGLIMAMGSNEFLGAGRGFRVSFKNRTNGPDRVGIAAISEGHFDDGKWIGGRRLNGDENDQGRFWRFDSRKINIEKVELYQYRERKEH